MAKKKDPNKRFTYNTFLPGIKAEMFSRWLSEESKRQGRPISMDLDTYDVMGFYDAGEKLDNRGHGTDYFKKPYHPTFSDQSKYHGSDGYYGGKWTDSSFIASPTNMMFNPPEEMLWQMQEDPGIKLQYGNKFYTQDDMKKYPKGGEIKDPKKERRAAYDQLTQSDRDQMFMSVMSQLRRNPQNENLSKVMFKDYFGRNMTPLDSSAIPVKNSPAWSWEPSMIPQQNKIGIPFSQRVDKDGFPMMRKLGMDYRYRSGYKKLPPETAAKYNYDNEKRYYDAYYKLYGDEKEYPGEGLPEYDFGGWVKDNKQGILGGAMAVAGGALMATGIGAPIAMPLISGGLGMVGNEFASDQVAAQQQDMMNQQVGPQGSSNPYVPTFRCGGKVKMPFGGTVTAPAELEKDEVFRTPDGKIAGLVDDQSIAHENGGAPMELPVGTEVLGKKKDKQSGKMFKELGQILAKKNKKLQELKDKTKNKYTLNSIRAMENKYQQKFSDLFRRQEESKGGKMAKGGMVKYSNGSTVEPPLEYEDWMSEAFVPHEYISPGMESYINNMNPELAFQNNQMLNEIPPIAEGTPLTPEIKLSNPGVSFDNKVSGALGSQGLGTAMQFAPVAYNLIQSLRKPEKERLPEDYNRAVSTLSNRRYNIEPMLEANRTAQQIYDQNLKQAGAGAGQLASGRLASLGSRMRADMGAWAQKNNTEQGLWAPQTAQALMNRGQAQRGVDVANLQNEAARRNFGASATEGLAQGFATQQLMRNMKDRDYMAIQTYAKWLPMLANQFGDLDYVKQALNRG